VSVNGAFGRPRRIGVLLVYTENTSRHLAAPFSFTISNSGH